MIMDLHIYLGSIIKFYCPDEAWDNYENWFIFQQDI